MRRRGLYAAAFMVIAVLLAGCGSSSKSRPSAASSPPASSTSTSVATSATPGAAPVVVTTKHNRKLGTILAAGPKRLTVYLFEGDSGPVSSCPEGPCKSTWPPVTGKPTAAGAAVSSNLGTLTRPDGSTQVTYKGHPLYFYVKDVKPGDAYGEAIRSFGAKWYVLAPSGKTVGPS